MQNEPLVLHLGGSLEEGYAMVQWSASLVLCKLACNTISQKQELVLVLVTWPHDLKAVTS